MTDQIQETHRAVEALAMIVVGERLHPAITGFDGESASEALGSEHLVPIGLAVRLAILQEERTVAEELTAIRACEALGMELLTNRIQAVSLKKRNLRTVLVL